MKRLFLILSFLLFSQSSFCQISGIINIYTKVLLIDPPCNKITVQSSAGFSVGDTVLLIQIQGASAVQTNGATFGDLSIPNDAGNYEFAEISAIETNDLYLKHTLINTYNPNGSVQLVSVPQYTNITISGTLTAQEWNGSTGGVLVFEASGIVTLNANIDVSEKGFRGGSLNPPGGDCMTSSNTTYFYASSSVQGGRKGESIAIIPTGLESGRGKFTNGGGGGNSHNTGGGGGGNYGAGGRGGNKSGTCTFGASPYGFGGIALNAYYPGSSAKIFMGGGGGAGQQNNSVAFPGGNGGGIVIIKATTLIGMGNLINSDGQSVPIYPTDNGDGNGGGGAGGTVLLSIADYSSLIVNASGGTGGSTNNLGNPVSQKDFGPGGGGGGGVIWVSTAALPVQITPTIDGGSPGNSLFCNCPHGAEAGTAGNTLANLSLQRSAIVFNQTCISLPVELLNFSGILANEKVKLEWATSSEINNAYFTIEKTTDLAEFKTIAKVNGNLTSNTSVSYFAYDADPADGISYYRLSQTDMDGTTKILGIVSIKNISTDKLIRKIYPIPFHKDLFIELNRSASLSGEVEITIYTILGEQIYVSTHTISEKISLTLPDWSAGIYTIIIQSDDQMEIAKVVKGH